MNVAALAPTDRATPIAEHFLPLFAQAFPGGQIHRLPGVGHYSAEDAPEEIARLVADFVAAS